MNKQEFETLTKIDISDEAYTRIERIYMAAPNIDKELFCNEYKWNKLYRSATVWDLTQANEKMTLRIQNLEHDLEMAQEESKTSNELIASLRQANNDLECERNKIIAEKVDLALVLLRNGLDEQAIEILGHGYVISLKCSADIELSKADKLFLAQTFAK